MRPLALFLCLTLCSVQASAAIFKCVKEGRTTYQSTPCESGAKETDVSHLQNSQRMYSPGQRQAADDSTYYEYRQQQIKREFQHNRDRDRYEAQRKRDRAVAEARRQSEAEARAKAERDRRYREDKLRRKARNSGNYEYWDIRTR